MYLSRQQNKALRKDPRLLDISVLPLVLWIAQGSWDITDGGWGDRDHLSEAAEMSTKNDGDDMRWPMHFFSSSLFFSEMKQHHRWGYGKRGKKVHKHKWSKSHHLSKRKTFFVMMTGKGKKEGKFTTRHVIYLSEYWVSAHFALRDAWKKWDVFSRKVFTLKKILISFLCITKCSFALSKKINIGGFHYLLSVQGSGQWWGALLFSFSDVITCKTSTRKDAVCLIINKVHKEKKH